MRSSSLWKVALGALLVALIAAGCAWERPVTVASDGSASDGQSSSPTGLSADGRYAVFDSYASNLVPGGGAPGSDVYVHDAATGRTTLVSAALGGGGANGDSFGGPISWDGRYVVFRSFASNLVTGDTNGAQDVFVRDLQTGVTQRMSVASNGTQGNGPSSVNDQPTISGDGRFVAFASAATNLVAGDTNVEPDQFVHDRVLGTTERVSIGMNGTQSNGWSGGEPGISADGRFVDFDSTSSNLVAGDTNGLLDAFVFDRQSHATERVSVASGGTQGNGNVAHGGMELSADGRFATFTSAASNLVPGDTNGLADVFVRDRQAHTTERVNVTSAGAQTGGDDVERVFEDRISADGRFVSFDSYASDVVPADTNFTEDTFVHDRATGRTVRVSVSASGEQGNSSSGNNDVSPDGRYILYGTVASNLVQNGNAFGYNVIESFLARPEVTSVSPASLARGATAVMTLQGAWFMPDAVVRVANANGITVGFVFASAGTVITQFSVASWVTPGTYDVLVMNPGTGPGPLTGATGICQGCLKVT